MNDKLFRVCKRAELSDVIAGHTVWVRKDQGRPALGVPASDVIHPLSVPHAIVRSASAGAQPVKALATSAGQLYVVALRPCEQPLTGTYVVVGSIRPDALRPEEGACSLFKLGD